MNYQHLYLWQSFHENSLQQGEIAASSKQAAKKLCFCKELYPCR